MSTPILSLDCDGVLADGTYIPEWDRHPEVYRKLKLVDENVPAYLHMLCRKANVYVVSSRCFDNAVDVTRMWLQENGVYLSMLAGVICNIPSDLKPEFVQLLGARLHVDDNPTIVRGMGAMGLLLALPNSQWPTNGCGFNLPQVHNWHELYTVVDSIL